MSLRAAPSLPSSMIRRTVIPPGVPLSTGSGTDGGAAAGMLGG
ncbi:hypothetical protein [Brachybacterium sp. NPDC056505]